MLPEKITGFVSSVSKKVPLIKSLRKSMDKIGIPGKIIGGDVNPNCIGKYFVDQLWTMPPLQKLTPEAFVSFCQKNEVNFVIPTRDGELIFYAENRDFFAEKGIKIMVSEHEAVRICLDKLLFCQAIKRMGLPSIETVETIESIATETFVVKERYGSGSRNIGLNLTKEEAIQQAKTLEHPIFQPFIEGEEMSVDLYLDRSGRTKGVIARQRNLVVNGESQITTSFRNSGVEEICSAIAEKLEMYGHVMFQLIHNREDGLYHILECNPRYGGASNLSVEMGLDSFYWFINETIGKDLSPLPFDRSEKEKKMIRYPEDLILS